MCVCVCVCVCECVCVCLCLCLCLSVWVCVCVCVCVCLCVCLFTHTQTIIYKQLYKQSFGMGWHGVIGCDLISSFGVQCFSGTKSNKTEDRRLRFRGISLFVLFWQTCPPKSYICKWGCVENYWVQQDKYYILLSSYFTYQAWICLPELNFFVYALITDQKVSKDRTLITLTFKINYFSEVVINIPHSRLNAIKLYWL